MTIPQNAVQARFFLRTIEMSPQQKGGKVVLGAACRGDRNALWAQATPSGELWMQVNQAEGFEWFENLLRAAQNGEIKYPEVDIIIRVAEPTTMDPALHAFVESTMPEGYYGHGNCGVCGMAQGQHKS